MNESSQDDRDIASLRAIQAGGKERGRGVADLFRAYRGPMLGFFMRNRVDPAEAEDLLQEVFISAVRQADSFRGESRVSTWLWTIARNRLIDHVRARKPETQLDDEGWMSIGESHAQEPAEDRAGIEDCVSRAFQRFARASAERAEALRRVALDGWSIEDLARFLGRTPAATREYLSQCRKRLREFLEPCRELLGAEA